MLTDVEALARMQALNTGDTEADHVHADALLCELLSDLGYTKTVEAYDSMDKWFA